jgi:glycosyltransferase involved in cell wall biosynthesis
LFFCTLNQMRCPTLAELPPPPPGKTGWPWTEECPQLPDTRPDGSPWPRITIVTPSYNQGEFIEETIRSVLLQGYPDLEYFIMDGGSTDESVDKIIQYQAWLSHWCTGKDSGQADAITKALERASGIWFHNVNSDDVLLPNALQRIGSTNTAYAGT